MCPIMKASVCRTGPREGEGRVAMLGEESERGGAPASGEQVPVKIPPSDCFLLAPLLDPHLLHIRARLHCL